MILTCPECATSYFVPDDRIGPAGRRVRCHACAHSWRAVADEPLELISTPEDGAAGGETFGKREETPETAPELPKAFRARAEQQRRNRRMAAAGAVWRALGPRGGHLGDPLQRYRRLL